jgi:hypothetical protein
LGPRHRGGGLYAAGKRKSLLYRVLNLSSSRERRSTADEIAEPAIMMRPASEYPTSAI